MLARLRIIGMLFKEFKLLVRRRKTPVLALTLPLLLLIIYSAATAAISNPQSFITAGVCSNDPQANEIINLVEGNFEIFRLTGDDCISELINKVRSGEFLIGFVIPDDFSATLGSGKQAMITYYVDDSNPVTASMSSLALERGFNSYSRSVVTSTEQELERVSGEARDKLQSALLILNSTRQVIQDNKALLGITFNLMNDYLDNAINELTSYDEELAFVEDLDVGFLTNPVIFGKGEVYSGVNTSSFNFATIFCIVSLFTLLLLASTGIIFDKKTNYLLRIKATGTFLPTYLLSKVVFYLAISLAQFFLVMLLMMFQGAVYNFNIPTLLASFAVVTTLNTSIGLFIGSISENENVAILFSLTLSLPFLFLSGAFFPLEFMPVYIKWIARVVPLYTEINLLKQVSVLGLPMSLAEPMLIELGVISLVLLVINYLVIKYK